MSYRIFFYKNSLNEIIQYLPNRSLFFGEGVFETFRYKSELPVFFDRHLTRLNRASDYLCIPCPSVDILEDFVTDSVSKSGYKDAYVKICLFSYGGNIYSDKPQNYVLCSVIKQYPPRQDNITICIAGETKNSTSKLNYHKTTNYLQNVISKKEAMELGYEESMFINEKGNVTECTAHNIFWIKDNKIFTPSVENGLLAGVTRGVVIEICRKLSVFIQEGEFDVSVVQNADGIFLTNAISGMVGVNKFEGKEYEQDGELYKIIEENLLTRLKWN